jgi:hypothetical protein
VKRIAAGSRRRIVLLCVAAVLVAGAAFAARDDFAAVRSAEEWVERIVDPDPTPVRLPAGPPDRVGQERHALVWAVGDGDGGEASRALVDRIARTRPDLLLYLGDVYPRGTPGDFARNYASTYGRLSSRTAPTPGNHEWAEVSEGYEPYWRRTRGSVPPSFYAIRAGGWEILALNSEAPHADGSAQIRWLGARLKRPGTCRLAFWHRPRFSAGSVHGDEPDTAPLWRSLRGHARIVVNGHEHDSQRFRPIDGITEFVAGAGGHGLYPLRKDDRLAFGDDTHYAALRLHLRPRTARYAFVTADGHVHDAGIVRCSTG